MDNLTVTRDSAPGGQWILQALERLIDWTAMSFKPASLVLKRGKVVDSFRSNVTVEIWAPQSEVPRLGSI